MKVKISEHAKFPEQREYDDELTMLQLMKRVTKDFGTNKFTVDIMYNGEWITAAKYVHVRHTPSTKFLFEIWVEGFVATGQSGIAHRLATSIGETFDDAVRNYSKSHPTSTIDLDRYGKGKHAIWACQLYDNEQDARKSFG